MPMSCQSVFREQGHLRYPKWKIGKTCCLVGLVYGNQAPGSSVPAMLYISNTAVYEPHCLIPKFSGIVFCHITPNIRFMRRQKHIVMNHRWKWCLSPHSEATFFCCHSLGNKIVWPIPHKYLGGFANKPDVQHNVSLSGLIDSSLHLSFSYRFMKVSVYQNGLICVRVFGW